MQRRGGQRDVSILVASLILMSGQRFKKISRQKLFYTQPRQMHHFTRKKKLESRRTRARSFVRRLIFILHWFSRQWRYDLRVRSSYALAFAFIYFSSIKTQPSELVSLRGELEGCLWHDCYIRLAKKTVLVDAQRLTSQVRAPRWFSGT